MYRMLQRNLKAYFKLYKSEDTSYRYQIAKILEGLMDKKVYDRWRIEDPEKYAQVNNIVYAIRKYTEEFPRFETLSWDLWGLEYEAIKEDRFYNEDLVEQIKLINLCLGAAYLE